MKIEVKVEEIGDKLYLTQHFGDGALGKTKFDASHTLPNMGLLIKINERRYLVSSQEIIEEVINLHNKNNK